MKTTMKNCQWQKCNRLVNGNWN